MAESKPQSFDDFLHRMGEFFKGLSFAQQAMLAGGVVLVGATLWLFVVLLGQPKYVTLYSGLRPEEAQALGGRLAAKNIPHQILPDGGSLLIFTAFQYPGVPDDAFAAQCAALAEEFDHLRRLTEAA